MELFCDKHAPGLFNELQQVITNDEKGQISKRRAATQRQRVVAMLHQFSYFPNQVSWWWLKSCYRLILAFFMAFVQLPTPLKTYRVVGGSTKASQLTQGLTFFFSLLNYDRKITHCNKIVVSTCPFMVPGMIIQLCCQNNFISCSTSDLDVT